MYLNFSQSTWVFFLMMNNVISKLKDPWHVNLWTDKVLYARKSGEVEELPENLLNGNKISVEDAIVSTVPPKSLLKECYQNLKTLCWGGPGCVPNPEWIHTGIIFHSPAKVHAFGLQLSSGAQKAFQVILQAYILKYLFFGSLKNGVKPAGLRQRPSKTKPANM